jgi:hypothetical protein
VKQKIQGHSESTPNTRKIHAMNTDLLKHGFRVTTYGTLNKMLEVSTMDFNTGRCAPEQ